MTKITIIPLGTVSPYCKDEHNCPGFLVLYKNQKILLDCGNGITRYMDFPSGLENLNVIITCIESNLSLIPESYRSR